MIELFHVTKSYVNSPRPALREVSLRVEKGDFVFLTGPSGAGKSTLLRLILGAERPTTGQILVAGQNVGQLRRRHVALLRRQIGIIFQDFKLIPNRSVYENIALALTVAGRGEAEIRQRTYTVLKSVGLFHKQHALPRALSGGEQQRVAVARALANDPPIVLADEPTGNLDGEASEAVVRLLNRAHTRGATVLVATHDHALIRRSGRPSIVLRHGLVNDRPQSDAMRLQPLTRPVSGLV